jgi:integrase
MKLQIKGLTRDLALFNLAIDGKLRGCDVVAVRVDDVAPRRLHARSSHGPREENRSPGPVRNHQQDPSSHHEYLRLNGRKPGDFLLAGRGDDGCGLTTRQYARLVNQWVASIGPDPIKFGTHSLRRTKATLIYRRT